GIDIRGQPLEWPAVYSEACDLNLAGDVGSSHLAVDDGCDRGRAAILERHRKIRRDGLKVAQVSGYQLQLNLLAERARQIEAGVRQGEIGLANHESIRAPVVVRAQAAGHRDPARTRRNRKIRARGDGLRILQATLRPDGSRDDAVVSHSVLRKRPQYGLEIEA